MSLTVDSIPIGVRVSIWKNVQDQMWYMIVSIDEVVVQADFISLTALTKSLETLIVQHREDQLNAHLNQLADQPPKGNS